jgi:hypothetical protein
MVAIDFDGVLCDGIFKIAAAGLFDRRLGL